MVFTEDMVFLRSLLWFGGVMAFPVGVRRLVIHGVATRRGAAGRCTSTGAVIGARGRVWSRLGRVVDLLVSLLAAGVVTGWSAG